MDHCGLPLFGEPRPALVYQRFSPSRSSTPSIRDGYWGDVPARECGKVGGKIGGNIVKVMIRHAEQALEQNQGQGRSNL